MVDRKQAKEMGELLSRTEIVSRRVKIAEVRQGGQLILDMLRETEPVEMELPDSEGWWWRLNDAGNEWRHVRLILEQEGSNKLLWRDEDGDISTCFRKPVPGRWVKIVPPGGLS